MKYCTKCGASMEDEANFCPTCGHPSTTPTPTFVSSTTPTSTSTQTPPVSAPSPASTSDANAPTTYSSGSKTTASYFFSILGAVVSFLVRLNVGGTYWSFSSFDSFHGIDADMKPLYSLIPLAAAILVSLLIVSDRHSDSHRKAVAFIVNIIFIVIAILCIWVDIPINDPYYY